MAWSSPSSRGQDKGKDKTKEITAEKLGEEYVANFEKFAIKYQEKAIRVRGKLKIIDGEACFLTGKKLANGKPLMILLAVRQADLKKYPEGSIVVADSSLMSVNEFRLILQKARLLPGTKEKPK
jgi:hypothetical protein